MFDADRPIINSSQDRLNRSTFAKYLARSMLDHRDSESLVIGLYGGFGVGKTSIINMVVEELNFAATNLNDDETPIILNFSPWSYSGQNQLIYSFYRRLSATLRAAVTKNPELVQEPARLENADRIIYLLELYASFFTGKPVPKPFRHKRSLLEKLSLTQSDSGYAWESGRDLTFVKAELNELLRKQKHKIIIIIDNIARLYDYEIKQIFQIVKSMGDYTNTVYLLSIDKEQVARAINQLDGAGGEAYIEKIVQLPFEVPAIQSQDLEKILINRLNEVLKLVPEGAFQQEAWADIYYGSLRYFFTNCRDITRYVNTLNFSYLRLRDVVNPVDFFALIAIQVFLPQIYNGIRDNKDLFTDLLDSTYVIDKDLIQKDKMRCDEILSRNKRIDRALLLDLLMRLFPRLRYLYQPDVIFYHSDAVARKLRRISSEDLFDVYFRLSMQAAQIPYTEFETLLKISADKEAFDHALTRLNKDDRIISFLDLLDSNAIITVPHKNIPAIVSALIDDGDLFPHGKSSLLNLDTPKRINRIMHVLLKRYGNADERFLLLQDAIANASKSIYIIVNFLEDEGREHISESDNFMPLEYRYLTPEQLESLRHLASTRIAYWAETNRLIEHPQLLPILKAWLKWDEATVCQDYVKKITDTDRGLVLFLTHILEHPINQAMTKYEINSDWEFYLDDIAEFIPVTDLVQHAKLIFENDYFEKLREREQLALMIFLDITHTETKKIIPKTTV